MNKVVLIGNLTKDPELSTSPSGVSVCHFSIAVNRSYVNGDGERLTDFFNCYCWRSLAESIAKYSKKGKKICVVGSIQIRHYEDNAGLKKVAVDILAETIEFLTPMDKPVMEVEEPIRKNKKEKNSDSSEDDSDLPF